MHTKLILNINKTNYMHVFCFFTNKHIDNAEDEVNINGDVIKCCNSLKFVGVQIDSKLSWHIHVEYICNKIRLLVF